MLNEPSVSSYTRDRETEGLITLSPSVPIPALDGPLEHISETLREKYAILDKFELLEMFLSTEYSNSTLAEENFALIEQVNESQRALEKFQSEIAGLKLLHKREMDELYRELDAISFLADERESRIVYLEDHSRFSADQTKLSIAHWDLLLRNRDENIELLTHRITQLTNENVLSSEAGGFTIDKYKCLLERYQALYTEYVKVVGSNVKEDVIFQFSDPNEKVVCPWKNQADVRVAQLERVTGQLNSTFEQLHAKSDEVLLLSRTIGELRKKNFTLEAKVKKYKGKLARYKTNVTSSPEFSSTPPPESSEEYNN